MTKFVTKVQNAIAVRKNDEEGAGMVEYGILVAFIGVALIAAATTLRTEIGTLFTSINLV